MKLRTTLANLLLAGVTLLIVFGGAEFGFRTFGAKRLFTYFDEQTQRELGNPIPKKSADEYRIFIFGGSSAYGFPVADRYSIAAWLRKSFRHLLPGKKVHVMNCAWPGKGSHHEVEGAHVVLKYQPDLFIIYSGHNEAPTNCRLYLDSWLYRLDLCFYFRSALYRYLSTRLNRIRKHIVYGHSGYAEKFYRDEVIANKVYKKAEVTDEDYERILKRFKENLEAIIQIAKRHDIDVLLMTPPSNIRNIPPLASSHHPALTKEKLLEWNQFFQQGSAFALKGQYEEAIQAYQKASALDPTFAELRYQEGIAYERLGRYEKAGTAYRMARDFDRLPWRAKTSLIDSVREMARQNDLILVDLVRIFEALSPHGIIGSQLVYDNVHPSVEAQQVITDEILRALAAHGKIAPPEQWDWKALEVARENKESEEWKVEGDVNAYRYILRGLHLWQGKRYGEAAQDLQKGLELMPAFSESYVFLGDAYWHLGEIKKAGEMFQVLAQKEPALLEILLRKYPDLRQSYMESTQRPRMLSQ